jgi:flavin-dependent dehydrogenase
MHVVVVEPKTGAVDKACGEGIMPAARVSLDEMGIELPTGRTFKGVRYHHNGASATGRFRSGLGLGIHRVELSQAMWQRAHELGVERRKGWIRDVRSVNGYVEAMDIRAGWMIGADGLHSTVRKALDIPVVQKPRGRYGIRRHFRTRSQSDFVDVYLSNEAEAYVTPVGDGIVGVAILSSAPQRFEGQLAGFPRLARLLDEPVGNARGAGPFRRFSRHVRQGRVALVGDAAGFVDPITGEGIRLGFESSRLAVKCMLEDCLADYEPGWRKIMRTYQLVTSSILVLRRNRSTRELLVPTLRVFPFVFDRMLGLLGDA